MVQDILVGIAECRFGVGDDDAAVCVQRLRVGAEYAAVNLKIPTEGKTQVIDTLLVQLAVSLQESDSLCSLFEQGMDAFGKGVFQVLNAVVEILLAAQSALVLQQG